MQSAENYSGFLYAAPSFLAGFISVLDWAGTLNEYNFDPDFPELYDYLALKSDWDAVGQDLRYALDEATRENQ